MSKQTMDIPDPETPPASPLPEGLLEALSALSFPMSKRELFGAFALMGLASRLQPIHLDSTPQQQRVMELAQILGDGMVARYER